MTEPNNRHWYARRAGQVRGPLARTQVTREILLGRIRSGDELSPDREQWRGVSQLPELLPDVLRQADSPEGRQRLTLARLREDERYHERRTPRPAPVTMNRRQRDRRTVESLAAIDTPILVAGRSGEDRDGRNLLVPAAALLTLLFLLFMAYIWGRPVPTVSVRDCRAPPAAAVNWSGCDLSGRDLAHADLRGARLGSANLNRANLNGADLSRAELRYAELNEAALRNAVLREAVLVGALLNGADLFQADLRNADLGHTSLQGAALVGAELSGARLGGAVWTDGRVCAPDSIGACR